MFMDLPEQKRLKRRGRPPKVALLVETSNAYARRLLGGVNDFIRRDGPWNVYLSEHRRGDPPPDWLERWDGDGILARIENEDIAGVLSRFQIPIVDLSSRELLPDVSTVTTDNKAISRMALEHFIERGFTRFAFCGDDRFAWSVARAEHFSAFVKDAGCSCEHYSGSEKRESDSDEETDAIAQWLGRLSLPVAIFACYDARGQQVLEACRRAGLSVPEQVAVLGVDNDEVLCALTPPPMSSIIPNAHRTGWLAAELLGRMMSGSSVTPAIHYVPPVGVANRQSTDCLAVDDHQLACALRYIREHACEGIRVSDVLRYCPMSRRSLENRMREILGRTPHEEILRVQLLRAKELLAGTDLTLAEVAERSGFRHSEYLSVAFKREIGIVPSEYRRNNGRPT